MDESEVHTGMPVIYLVTLNDKRFGIVGTGRQILFKNTTNGPCYITYIQVIKCNGDNTFYPVNLLTPYCKPKTI